MKESKLKFQNMVIPLNVKKIDKNCKYKINAIIIVYVVYVVGEVGEYWALFYMNANKTVIFYYNQNFISNISSTHIWQ